MLVQNLLSQLSALVLGVIAAAIVALLAEEEVEEYTPLFQTAAKIVYVITLVAPVLFLEKIVTVLFIAISYGVIAFPQKNERQTFYLLAPLSLVLATQNTDAFLVTLSCFFVATLLSTILFLTTWVKKKKLTWKREIINKVIKQYSMFVLISCMVYVIIWVFG